MSTKKRKTWVLTLVQLWLGPFTFLQLSDFEEGVKAEDFVDSLVAAYQDVFC